MKIKSPVQVVDVTNSISNDVLRHVQALTDDVRGILAGGLSFIDKQLPFQIRTVTVFNNQPILLNIQGPFATVGCIPIQTNGAIINSVSSSNNSGKISIILDMNVNSAQIVFLLIGTNI